MRNCLAVDGVGSGGGLALFWDESFHLDLLSYTNRHIDVLVKEDRSAMQWRCTFVYGEPKAHERHNMWTLLRRIKPNSTAPWCLMGDFNEAMWQFEHFSEHKRKEKQMLDFREILSHCDVFDLGFIGTPWTYDNKRKGGYNVRVRLDRAVASQSWSVLYPQAQVRHLVSSRSDHCPILVQCTPDEDKDKPSRCMRYEILWEREESLSEEIRTAWEQHHAATDLGSVSSKLKLVMGALQHWSREKFGSVNKELGALRKKMEELQLGGRHTHDQEYQSCSRRMEEILYREEMMWLQRSRVAWLREGDRNTSFHRKAAWRHRKNKISKLFLPDGSWTDQRKEMEKMATNFFKDLYTKDPLVTPQPLLDLIMLKVTEQMNEDLCKAFSDKEISDALFQIGPIKAPGPDGFPARFFQRNWEVLKNDVCKAVKLFFDQKVMPEGVNTTAIVLIPKKKESKELKDFRPISLCNVIYKVVAKCLVNHLRPILESIISQEQSAFIPGRMITDNALIAFECFHNIAQSKRESQEFCAYKLDLAKAYDRVDWQYLEGVLDRMGFSNTWIQWMMACVTSVRYAVRFNGSMLKSFQPSRGLRQGDPLSPYLFLFVADGLSTILSSAVRTGDLVPLKVCRQAPGISHLLFADDSLLFFKANVEQATVVKEALNLYERCTSQLLSPAKCSMLFGKHCSDQTQPGIKSLLDVQQNSFEDKYLGLPTPEGRMKADRFQSIKERFFKRLIDWAEKHLPMGGKEVLIKSVIQALPTYMMSVFKLPPSFCEEYMQLVRKFWWGEDRSQRKVHWASWQQLIKPKSMGGMGFKDMKIFNQALLARQAWRLVQFPDSLCARVLKAKYYPNGDLLDTAFSSVSSDSWKGIVHGLELLKKGVIWRIGTGRKVHIWRDDWLPREHGLKVMGKKTGTRLKWVSDLLVPNEQSWDEQVIRHIFFPS